MVLQLFIIVQHNIGKTREIVKEKSIPHKREGHTGYSDCSACGDNSVSRTPYFHQEKAPSPATKQGQFAGTAGRKPNIQPSSRSYTGSQGCNQPVNSGNSSRAIVISSHQRDLLKLLADLPDLLDKIPDVSAKSRFASIFAQLSDLSSIEGLEELKELSKLSGLSK